MLSRATFSTLRLSMLSPDRAARAPEKARRLLVFGYGTERLDKMTDEAKREAYERALADELRDVPEDCAEYHLDQQFHVAEEDGLSLYYPESSPDTLARLEARLTTAPASGVVGLMAAAMSPSDVDRETAHMAALGNYGWPFAPRASWTQCLSLLESTLPQRLITAEWQAEDGHLRRNVWGLADGLYINLHFCAQQLTDISIQDLACVQDGLLMAEDLDLASLESIMTYVHDLPDAKDVEFCHPQFESFKTAASGAQNPAPAAAPAAAPADECAWLQKLTPEESKTFRTLFATTDFNLIQQVSAAMYTATSLADFIAMREQLISAPGSVPRVEEFLGKLSAQSAATEPAPSPAVEPQMAASPLPTVTSSRPLREEITTAIESLESAVREISQTFEAQVAAFELPRA